MAPLRGTFAKVYRLLTGKSNPTKGRRRRLMDAIDDGNVELVKEILAQRTLGQKVDISKKVDGLSALQYANYLQNSSPAHKQIYKLLRGYDKKVIPSYGAGQSKGGGGGHGRAVSIPSVHLGQVLPTRSSSTTHLSTYRHPDLQVAPKRPERPTQQKLVQILTSSDQQKQKITKLSEFFGSTSYVQRYNFLNKKYKELDDQTPYKYARSNGLLNISDFFDTFYSDDIDDIQGVPISRGHRGDLPQLRYSSTTSGGGSTQVSKTHLLSKLNVLKRNHGLDVQLPRGQTLLTYAIKKKDLPLLYILMSSPVQFGIDIHEKNSQGEYPFILAIQSKNPSIMYLFETAQKEPAKYIPYVRQALKKLSDDDPKKKTLQNWLKEFQGQSKRQSH